MMVMLAWALFLNVVSGVFHCVSWYSLLLLFSILFLLFPIFSPITGVCSDFTFIFVDQLSFSLVYLSIWVIILMLTSSGLVLKNNLSSSSFILMLSLLFASLFFAFSSSNMILFYFFFEFSLVPTIFLIMGWGSQVERLQATVYFLLYTMVASLPLLLLSVFFLRSKGAFDFHYYMLVLGSELPFLMKGPLGWALSWFMFGAFLVKLPMYMFHLWLPKAHVEAPVSGSMVLAGVLLKLGGFGALRVAPFFIGGVLAYFSVIAAICLFSMVVVSTICLRSNDLKSLVAYSSVSHMALGLAGIGTLTYMGVLGAILMLVGHGVCSSGLFSFINMIYERSSSRSLSVNKGLINLGCSLGLFMFLLSVINMAAPPSMNLFSELFLVSSVLSYSVVTLSLVLVGSFLVASYCIYLFSFSHHGSVYSLSFQEINLKEIESLVIVSHILPLLVSFMAVNFVV